MLLQYEELLLEPHHPECRPAVTGLESHMQGNKAPASLCVCVGGGGHGSAYINGTRNGVLFSILSKSSHWCQ